MGTMAVLAFMMICFIVLVDDCGGCLNFIMGSLLLFLWCVVCAGLTV